MARFVPASFPVSPDVVNFLYRVSIASQNRDSVTRALIKSSTFGSMFLIKENDQDFLVNQMTFTYTLVHKNGRV